MIPVNDYFPCSSVLSISLAFLTNIAPVRGSWQTQKAGFYCCCRCLLFCLFVFCFVVVVGFFPHFCHNVPYQDETSTVSVDLN